jgi:prepilin-type N-terminal cleavage/methylation domain-containing protein
MFRNLMFRDRSGFSLFEMMVVIAIIGVLTAILAPSIMKASISTRQKVCINNLRQIDHAIQQWSLETKALSTDIVTHSNLVTYLRVLPVCPSLHEGTFLSDYGMTFVKDPSFCVVNNSLEGSPHVLTPPLDLKTNSVSPRSPASP